jgi:DNA-binding beta-propeller fold protein YncE
MVIAACAAGLLVPESAAAGGGPVAPVQGGAGVSNAEVNYVAVRTGRGTLVERVRRDGGVVERARLIPGHFGVPGAAYDGSTTGLSADGRTLVLASMTMRGTRLLVLDTDTLAVRERVTRPDFLAPDAISPDGHRLYVLRYPKAGVQTYDVLALNLRTGRLNHTPIMDPREPDEQMGGTPVSRVMSPDGRWAYTLYMGEENFVHALDTLKGEARCIDLPGGDFSGQPLRLDGTTLFVGRAEKIDLRTFALATATAAPRATATPAPPEPGGGGVPWVPVVLGIAVLAGVALLLSARRGSLPSTA